MRWAARTAEKLKVVHKRPLPCLGYVLANCAAHEEDEDDRCRDPERSVQVGVALEDVEEVGPGVQRGPAPRENRARVNIEELGIERHAPEEALRGGPRGRHGGWQACRRRWSLAHARTVVVEVGGMELEVFLKIGVAEIALSSHSCQSPARDKLLADMSSGDRGRGRSYLVVDVNHRIVACARHGCGDFLSFCPGADMSEPLRIARDW